MGYDVVIVGGGIAGLTSAAYLSREGLRVLVCEKAEKVGGLVNSFGYKGFTFDGGIRAIENSGIVFPMLRQLGIEMEFVKSPVSVGIGNRIVRLTSRESLKDYEELLAWAFPENTADVAAITKEVSRVMDLMDILYGIDNPLFMDIGKDKEYLMKTLLPWYVKYRMNIGKAVKLNIPINTYMERFTKNESLRSMVTQHFFTDTPSFFALSYFSLYLDYAYPKGGTGVLIEKMVEKIVEQGGEIRTGTEVTSVNLKERTLQTVSGETVGFRKLVWAADLNRLYSAMDTTALSDQKVIRSTEQRRQDFSGKTGGDSIFTVYLTVDRPKEEFEKICSPHLFYTPKTTGLSAISLEDLKTGETDSVSGFTTDKDRIIGWLGRYMDLNTFEISIPVMRDDTLAPPGKTGIIASTLMDYRLVKHIADMGWYEEFKQVCEEQVIRVLDTSVFPWLSESVTDRFSSTPITIERVTGNHQGAITGWSFTNDRIPVENRFPKIAKSVLTPLPGVFQAGQWVFSPSGLPVSVLTGKLAADEVKKELKKEKK
ncbi:MAG TPA: NAD(P)/FAD-dependent oxidoreductase [Clostridiaceae bacterium]|nr:NAD(P)/FAD-dependent oxidoreductase [Clostridiaceae bacterium]